jgi:hypothetical protein
VHVHLENAVSTVANIWFNRAVVDVKAGYSPLEGPPPW